MRLEKTSSVQSKVSLCVWTNMRSQYDYAATINSFGMEKTFHATSLRELARVMGIAVMTVRRSFYRTGPSRLNAKITRTKKNPKLISVNPLVLEKQNPV